MYRVLAAVLIVFAAWSACAADSKGAQAEVELIFWESQSWEDGGERARLTLWADGRSETRVTRSVGQTAPKAKPGWTVEVKKNDATFTRKNPLSVDEAKEKFKQALDAGIRELKTFKITYNDGGGTLIGVKCKNDERATETIVPMFLKEGAENDNGSENHKRYIKVERVIGAFSTDCAASE